MTTAATTNKRQQRIKSLTQDSGNKMWFTPWPIIEAARELMGSIDLDPASCLDANYRRNVPFDAWNYHEQGEGCYRVAPVFFDEATDGLTESWFGNVFMNYPFGQRENKLWPAKLLAEYHANRVRQACMICFASTSEQWFAPLLNFPQFYFTGRTAYTNLYGQPQEGALKGSVLTFLPPRGIRYGQAVDMLAGAFLEFEGRAK